jgi:hypothetical protein
VAGGGRRRLFILLRRARQSARPRRGWSGRLPRAARAATAGIPGPARRSLCADAPRGAFSSLAPSKRAGPVGASLDPSYGRIALRLICVILARNSPAGTHLVVALASGAVADGVRANLGAGARRIRIAVMKPCRRSGW